MQSSSKLFPVSLVSAELRGDLTEDVYRLKPNNSPDASVELALTRLGAADCPAPGRIPVILLHGSFSNRRFWYSPAGVGLGAYLARAGFDVWLAEMRGHGLSPRNRNYRLNTIADYARYDLPAIAAFVQEQTARIPHWMGHSMGGVTLAAASGGRYLDEHNAASLALFGSQVSKAMRLLKFPPVEWAGRCLLRRCKVISGSRLDRGPEDEPIGVAIETLRWHGLFGRFGDRLSDWWAGLPAVRIPVMAVSAKADQGDPVWACRKLFKQFGASGKQFIVLARSEGFSADYGHVEMLVSKPAALEVWPLAVAWLNQQHVEQPQGERLAG
ncbi:alpha/beta fold hydrolase [Pseudomonas sp. N040]|uniref:alpha/beta fold hydrolase n=1 Tax=Pseudomonas sp. N040 TaxID=2785325 RepID=UPI0018A2FBC4|nr:alpha/beta fold hydrolase [Pseudomonas sp. N040]MBF7730774.1 alpha/beta fold hydrolase [Pseudomonas sp. N040]MBW7014417.1 lysophospholipase [Pseudomonas sp. N040]